MSKRLQKNKDKDADHIVYIPHYFQGELDKKTIKDYGFYINLGLYPIDTFDTLGYVAGLKPGHVKDLKEELTYRCPYNGNYYYGAFPVAYLSKMKPIFPDPKTEMEKLLLESADNFYKDMDTFGINHIGDIGRSLLGHGYKATTLSEDILTLGLCDIITQPNKDELIIFKTWKRLD